MSLVPDDVRLPLEGAKSAAESHAVYERQKKEYEHAYQWLALAYEISGMLFRLESRANELMRENVAG